MSDDPKLVIVAPNGAEHIAPSWRYFSDANALSNETVAGLDQSAQSEQRFVQEARERGRAHQEKADAAFRAAMLQSEERKLAAQLDEPELRQRLVSAILEHDDAVTAVYAANSHCERAKARMEAADMSLAQFRDLDAKITAYNVDLIRRDATGTLPDDLADAVQIRASVVDRIDAAHKAFDALQSDLKQAEQRLVDATGTRARAVALIVGKQADRLAQELEEALQEVVEMRECLATIGNTWVQSTAGGVAPIQLPNRALSAMREVLPEPKPNTQYQATLRDWVLRLDQDASALLEDGGE